MPDIFEWYMYGTICIFHVTLFFLPVFSPRLCLMQTFPTSLPKSISIMAVFFFILYHLTLLHHYICMSVITINDTRINALAFCQLFNKLLRCILLYFVGLVTFLCALLSLLEDIGVLSPSLSWNVLSLYVPVPFSVEVDNKNVVDISRGLWLEVSSFRNHAFSSSSLCILDLNFVTLLSRLFNCCSM
jgi:hypothetical protein